MAAAENARLDKTCVIGAIVWETGSFNTNFIGTTTVSPGLRTLDLPKIFLLDPNEMRPFARIT